MRVWRAFENFTIKLLTMVLAGLVLMCAAIIFLAIAVLLMFPIWGFVAVGMLLLRVL